MAKQILPSERTISSREGIRTIAPPQSDNYRATKGLPRLMFPGGIVAILKEGGMKQQEVKSGPLE